MKCSFAALAVLGITALPIPLQAAEPERFDSCAALRNRIDAMKPYEELRLTPTTFVCEEPVNPAADGLRIDFGGSTLKVADQALRPGIVIGDLQTPPRRRHASITILNLNIDGNSVNQAYECWGGPCDPATNSNPLWKERSNGITVNGCDDCTVINVKVTQARSGGMTVVSSERLLVDGFQAERSCFDGLAAYHTHHSLFRKIVVQDNDYAGFSFDGNFSHNRFEDFVARNNHDQGMFIRDASNNRFVRGLFVDNAKNGVYFDQDNRSIATTCASNTTLAGVTIRGSGQYGAWLQFACKGNQFVASELIDNHDGCLGGAEANLIGQSDTICRQNVDGATVVAHQKRPLCRRGS